MTSFELRPFEAADHPEVVRISRAVYGPQHDSVDEWRNAALPLDGEQRSGHRYVALAPDTGEIAAYGCAQSEPWLAQQGKCRVELLIHPEWQRRGIGRALSERLLEDARGLDARTAMARVLESRGDTLRFLSRRGFEEREWSWNLRVAVASSDLGELPAALARVEAQGIVLTTLAEERGRNPACLEEFVDLWNAVAADQPSAEPYTPPPFEAFVRWLEHPNRPPEACILARVGGRYAGLSMLQRRAAEPGWLTQNITGVRREYRRRGIATVLKLLALEYAGREGYEVITTTNDSRNEGMLALNERLGFGRHAGWVTLEKPLC